MNAGRFGSGPRGGLGRRKLLSVLPALAVGSSALGSLGCSGGVRFLAKSVVDPLAFEGDPHVLFPAEVLVYASVDVAAVFASAVGAEIERRLGAVIPVGLEANFVPRRDVSRLYAGVYGMQGLDALVVLRGAFNRDSMHASAGAKGLVRTAYGPYELVTRRNIGFSVLSSTLAIVGTETALRRSIDRIRYGKTSKEVPDWMIEVESAAASHWGVAGDLGADRILKGEAFLQATRATPVADVAAQNFSFLSALRAFRAVGNFGEPGVNWAATLSYASSDAAASGASSLRGLSQMTQMTGLLSFLGVGLNIPPLNITVDGSDVAVLQSLDGPSIRMIWDYLLSSRWFSPDEGLRELSESTLG